MSKNLSRPSRAARGGGVMNGVLLSGAALAAGVAGALGFQVRAANKSRARLRTKLREQALPRRAQHRSRWTMMGALEELTRKLYVGSTRLIFTRRAAKGGSTAGPRSFFAHHSKMAGCAGRISSDAFCERLLKEKNVAVVPGTAFGASGEGFIRVSYCYSIEHIKTALKRIEEFLGELKNES